MPNIERAIANALIMKLNNPRLKVKDIQEWSTSKTNVEKNLLSDKEILVELEELGIYCAVLKSADKRKGDV